MRYVILRDDDTNALTPIASLERLYRPFLERGLPVNLATIPEVRTDVCIPDGSLEGYIAAGLPATQLYVPLAESRPLVDYLHAEPGYRIVHHGCHHEYFEFGTKERAQLVDRLDHGARRLEECGFHPPSAFVAPYDRLSREAYVAVVERFPVLSTGWFEAGRVPVRWWPGYAAKKLQRRPHWRADGTALLSHPGCLLSYQRPYDTMFETVRRAVENRSLTVLVTHWWEYFRGGTTDDAFIEILHQVAAWLADQTDIRVVSFGDIASGDVPID